MMRLFTVIFLVSGLLLNGCDTPGYLVKKGDRLAKARDHEQAVTYYNAANSKDPSNRDAKKGLKKSGQKVLDELLEAFEEAYESNNFRAAAETFKKADTFYANLNRRGVLLEFPATHREHYKDAVEKLVHGMYLDAARSIDAGDYETASATVRDIERYDPSYPNLKMLKTAIEADPIYTKGLDAYRRGEKGKAIVFFTQVQQIAPDYRETNRFVDELMATSKLVLALFPFGNTSQEPRLSDNLYSEVQSELWKQKNPLLQVFAKEQLAAPLAGAKLNADGLTDDALALKITSDLGGNKALLGTVIEYDVKKMPDKEVYLAAYQRERVIYYDPYYGQQSTYQYREVKYREVTSETKVTVSLRVRILPVAAGAPVYTNVITKSVINQLKYADYGGAIEDLYPTTGYISNADLRSWRSRFDAVKDRKEVSELVDILRKEIAKALVSEILEKGFD